MDELILCDRCGTPITLTGYRATHKDGRELTLCKVHHREHDAALTKQGWAIERLTPPEPVAGPKSFVVCPQCKQNAQARMVQASPEAPAVRVVYCKQCDSRTCGFAGCDSKALSGRDAHCPKGHVLMPRDAP